MVNSYCLVAGWEEPGLQGVRYSDREGVRTEGHHQPGGAEPYRERGPGQVEEQMVVRQVGNIPTEDH